ncbi:MAG: lysophospholipid acyltransferase family protein [Bdellovibrio bacteriovorus]
MGGPEPNDTGLWRAVYEYLALGLGWGLLGILCLLWLPITALLYPLMPEALGWRLGRRVIRGGCRLYLRWLILLGACRFDLGELDALRDAAPLILAPNHPSLLDAVLVISRVPDLAVVLKAGLLRNPLLGPAIRLARWIPNDSLPGTIRQARSNLDRGSHLLLFPEGTRTADPPLGPLKASVGLIARRSGRPVQTLLIETDSGYLGKGWPMLRKPRLPVRYRVRLGRRFDPPQDVRAFTAELELYLGSELRGTRVGRSESGDGRPVRPAIG